MNWSILSAIRYVKDNVSGIERLIVLIGLPFVNKLINLFICVVSTPNDNDITHLFHQQTGWH